MSFDNSARAATNFLPGAAACTIPSPVSVYTVNTRASWASSHGEGGHASRKSSWPIVGPVKLVQQYGPTD